MTETITSPSNRLDLQKLFSNHELTVLRGTVNVPRTGPLVVVFCSKIKLDDRLEFAGSVAKAGRDALFVIDHHRTWFATASAAALVVKYVEQELEFRDCKVLDTIGFSMGAFAALAFAEQLPIRHVIAFGPRYSIEISTDEELGNGHALRHLGDEAVFRTLDQSMKMVTAAIVIHGAAQEDLPRIRRFFVPDNVDHWVMFGVDHHVADWFRRRNLLNSIVSAALDGDYSHVNKILRICGAKPKSSVAGKFYLTEFRGWAKILLLRRKILNFLTKPVLRQISRITLNKS